MSYPENEEDFVQEPTEENAEKSASLTEGIRKALLYGANAVFTSEDGLKNMVTDLKLPKEAVSFLLTQTDKGRREILDSVSGEVKRFLENVDIAGVFRKSLSGLTLEVKSEIKFRENDVEVQNTTVKRKTKKKTRKKDTKES